MPTGSEEQRYDAEVRDDWLDRLARFNQHFGRFLRDAVGVFLIAFALMSFLALGGYTNGLLLVPWAALLSLWFGWGSYLIVLAIAFTGVAILRRGGFPIGWGRLFTLEVGSFLTLALFAAMRGNSLLRAESGMDGGRIGWGLVTLFWRVGKLPGTLILFVLWVLALMTGFGIWGLIERWLLKVAGENQPAEMAIQPEVQEEAPVEKKEPEAPAPKKKSNQLPPEFR